MGDLDVLGSRNDGGWNERRRWSTLGAGFTLILGALLLCVA